MSSATEAVSGIPGADLTASRAWDGTVQYMSVKLVVGESFTGDVANLVEYSLAEIWSQNEVSIGRQVVFDFAGPGHDNEEAAQILTDLGIDSEPYGGARLALSNTDLEAQFGPWPGPSPEIPEGIKNG